MSLMLILLAGLMNGSFTVPAKCLKKYNVASIWFWFTLFSAWLLPWLILYFFLPSELIVFSLLKQSTLVAIVIGGFIFGLGQCCFAYSNDKLGVGLSFSVNIGTGIIIGTLIVFLSQLSIYNTVQVFLVFIPLLLILAGLILNYFLGFKNNNKLFVKKQYLAGWGLALLAGITSGIQNITFIYTLNNESTLHFKDNFWVWPLFLGVASLPMFFIFYLRKSKAINNISIIKIKHFLWVLFMGLCFTCSLWLYSKSVSLMSIHRQVTAWPIFMTVIILTSQFWSILFKDYQLTKKCKKIYFFISCFLLTSAIFLLSLKV